MVRHDVAESAGADGNAAQRGSQRHEQEIAYLRRKWGRYLDVVQAKGHL